MSHLHRRRVSRRMTEEELAAQVVRIYQRAQTETLELIQSQPAETTVLPARESG